MTNNENPVIEETTEPAKDSRLKKFLHNPKQLAIAAGLTLATIGGVIWFAVKRQDEEDFDSEFPEELEASETPVV